MENNLVMMSDSYKYSHPWQYPENMVSMFDYGMARSHKTYPATVFFGLQGIMKEYLSTPVTRTDIDEAQDYAIKHGIPFDIDGWDYISYTHGGFLPVHIRAVKEGTLVPTGNVLFTIESTDSKVPWIAGFLETLLMKVWYPCNIATRSYYVKKMLKYYWEWTVEEKDEFGINFALHNFGDRGSPSVESAALGACAHLSQFMGTDNFHSIKYADKFYSEPTAGFSIPATEHSSTTAWGKDREYDMLMTHIEFNKDRPMIAAVCDSYDYLATVRVLTSGEFKQKIESPTYPKFIIRPDSGDPEELIHTTLDIMIKNGVQYSTNEKGYKEFTNYGILWGDGIDMDVMERLLILLEEKGFAASNIAFGSGGWLMQQHDRDTQGWAVKCSSITVDEGSPIDSGDGEPVWQSHLVDQDVYKDPITDRSKSSLKGKVTLCSNIKTGEFATLPVDSELIDDDIFDILCTVYKDGEFADDQTLAEIRERS